MPCSIAFQYILSEPHTHQSNIDNSPSSPFTPPMKSMTGFGRATHTTDTWIASVEASSINRKQIEIVTNLPKHLTPLESNIRQTTSPHISRGRIQINVKLETPENTSTPSARINTNLAKSFEAAFSQLSSLLNRPILPSAADFARQPGIIELTEPDQIDLDSAWLAIQPALTAAIHNLNLMRSSEGDHLKTDLLQRLQNLISLTSSVSSLAPTRPERLRETLTKRLADLGIPLDLNDERLTKELAIFADRCDISEEITRLSSHFAKFSDYIHSSEPPGRPLDFLCQELFREFNTIGSKANHATISQTIVEAKSELEKIREQVQNIE